MDVRDLTIDEKEKLREHMSMKPFMLYLDDITKLEVIEKLKENGIDTKKGSLSALIRVLLTYFAESNSESFVKYICENVHREYLFTTKKNKRSKL